MKILTDRQKIEVRKYIKKWKSKLYLQQWDFEIVYHRDDSNQGLKINMNTQYKNATIEIHMDFWKFEKDKRESMIVHELCHCIVQPLIEIACRAAEGHGLSQREIDWHKESVTQHLATAIFY